MFPSLGYDRFCSSTEVKQNQHLQFPPTSAHYFVLKLVSYFDIQQQYFFFRILY